MIEQIVLNYLNDNLDVNVYTETPKEPPTSYAVIEKTGSSIDDYIKTATITVQSIAESMYQAALLNEEMKKVMDNIITLDDIARCKLNSDYNYTDVRTKQYRYQAVFNLTYY